MVTDARYGNRFWAISSVTITGIVTKRADNINVIVWRNAWFWADTSFSVPLQQLVLILRSFWGAFLIKCPRLYRMLLMITSARNGNRFWAISSVTITAHVVYIYIYIYTPADAEAGHFLAENVSLWSWPRWSWPLFPGIFFLQTGIFQQLFCDICNSFISNRGMSRLEK